MFSKHETCTPTYLHHQTVWIPYQGKNPIIYHRNISQCIENKEQMFGPIKFQLPKPGNYIYMHFCKLIGDIYRESDS